jgi:hypothetical protein
MGEEEQHGDAIFKKLCCYYPWNLIVCSMATVKFYLLFGLLGAQWWF